jgi:hypothetical protein
MKEETVLWNMKEQGKLFIAEKQEHGTEAFK